MSPKKPICKDIIRGWIVDMIIAAILLMIAIITKINFDYNQYFSYQMHFENYYILYCRYNRSHYYYYDFFY